MSFSKKDLDRAIEDLSLCEFFPADPGTRAALQALLVRICPSKEALEWLVRQFVDRIGKWHGPAELRAVLCTRFRPKDGIEGYSALPGFTAAESEAAVIAEHEQLKLGWIADDAGRPKQISADPEAQQLLRRLTAAKGIQ